MKFLTVLILAVSAALSGCKGTIYIDPDPLHTGWYNIYGRFCSWNPGPGCNYYWDGVKIIASEDPYYYTTASWAVYWDTYYTRGEWVYQSPTGIIYDRFGNALNKSGQKVSIDVLAQAGRDLEKTIQGAGKELANEYGISVTNGVKIARAFEKYNISNNRTPEAALKAVKEAYGATDLDLEKAYKGYTTHNEAMVQEVSDKLARQAGEEDTEAFAEMLKDLHSNVIDSISAK
jgi:hypothetical protein